jgi:hypothetical protein
MIGSAMVTMATELFCLNKLLENLGYAEKFQIWRAVLTYDQPKMSSFSVIRGYLCFLSLQFFEFLREFWIKFVK